MRTLKALVFTVCLILSVIAVSLSFAQQGLQTQVSEEPDTKLHKNILDAFNKYGVQIMTPAYEGDPDQPKVVPKDQWFATPAQPPKNREQT